VLAQGEASFAKPAKLPHSEGALLACASLLPRPPKRWTSTRFC